MSVTATRYTMWSGAVAIGVAACLIAVGRAQGTEAVTWSLLGWSIMALTGVAGGAWMTARHGQPNSRFLVALGTCMLARLFGAAAGAAAAVLNGSVATTSYLIGLGAAFVALQVLEIGWFLRKARRATAEVR